MGALDQSNCVGNNDLPTGSGEGSENSGGLYWYKPPVLISLIFYVHIPSLVSPFVDRRTDNTIDTIGSHQQGELRVNVVVDCDLVYTRYQHLNLLADRINFMPCNNFIILHNLHHPLSWYHFIAPRYSYAGLREG